MAAVIISIVSIGAISLFSIDRAEDRHAQQNMQLICEAVEKSMDLYFSSIEQSVQTISHFAEEELSHPDVDLSEHLKMIGRLFHSVASSTNEVLTYYYRIAPEVSTENPGYWYTRYHADAFVKAPLTDIEAYDPEDVSHVGWYTIPKTLGYASWLNPYFNENLKTEMISYVAPIYRSGEFMGVIGMDIDMSTLISQFTDLEIYDTGYAFLTDEQGQVIYHPTLENGALITDISEELTPERMDEADGLVRYRYGSVDKRAISAVLINGMRLYVTAPESEISAGWTRLFTVIILAGVLILVVFIAITLPIAGRITGPLQRLTEAAQQLDLGNYNVRLDYNRNDEVGLLTNVFRQMSDHLRSYISDLNSRVYVDSLTSVRNKGAYIQRVREMDEAIAADKDNARPFAICLFDCNNLKHINDTFGHENGDIYLKTACDLICRVYRYSPVFRIGGDEFVAILQGEDYTNQKLLARRFAERAEEISAGAENEWERVSTAMGSAQFNRKRDRCVADVQKRADTDMYQEKRRMKERMRNMRGGNSV